MAQGHTLPFDDTPSGPRVLSVTELTLGLKRVLESTFGYVAVEGEISNCRPWSSGHLYFTLKDERSQLRAVMFRTQARTLRFAPEDGLRVIVRGRLSLYEVKGEYQIVCETMEPHGLGARQAAFEQVKRRLEAEGLFDPARKRPLPVLPRRIGIVTSFDGAAIRDIVRILVTRHPSARIVVRAARVQGDGAAEDLVRGLRAIARVPDVDVVIIGRGGGSAEDLWAFNDERLARAISAMPVPVISAVGHEVDFTIADFVADVRAATPSNAAELVVDRTDNFCARIDRAEHRLTSAMHMVVSQRRRTLERAEARRDQWRVRLVLRERDTRELAARLRRAAASTVSRTRQQVTDLTRRLDRQDTRRLMAVWRTRLVAADGRLAERATHHRLAAQSRLAALGARLHALGPLAVLARGYAVCWNATKTGIIRSSRGVRPGDRVAVTLGEGELACRVEDVT